MNRSPFTLVALGGTLVGLAAATAWALTVGTPILLHGETSQGRAGYAVTVADLDADGFDDLLVGAPAFEAGDATGTNTDSVGPSGLTGEVLIYRGSATGVVDPPFVVLHGENPNDRFGAAIKVGDVVNGDGVKDVVVSALLASGHDAPRTGCVYVFDGQDVNNPPITPMPGHAPEIGAHDAVAEVCGEQYRELFGRAIELGEFDDVAGLDIAVGAPWYSSAHSHAAAGHPYEVYLAGAVYLISGTEIAAAKDAKMSNVPYEIHAERTPGNGWTAAYGENLLAMGDRNYDPAVPTDTREELLIFAPGAENHGHSGKGRAYLATWDPMAHAPETTPAGFEEPLVVIQGTGSLGMGKPAFVGDLNDDGISDIGMASNTGSGTPAGVDTNSAGGLYIVSGQLMDESVYKRYSKTVDPVTGETVTEVVNSLMTIPTEAFSLAAITGENAQDKFGTSIVGLGDRDEDLVDDFAIGAPWADTPATPTTTNTISGAVYIVSGNSVKNTIDTPDAFKFKIGSTQPALTVATIPAASNDRQGEVLAAGPLLPSATTAMATGLVVGSPDREILTVNTANDRPGVGSNDNRGGVSIYAVNP